MLNGLLRIILILGFVVTGSVVLSGCTNRTTAVDPAQIAPIPSVANNFDDIELPSEMKLDLDETMSIKTESFRGGILHYSGRVEIQSLKEFFITAMKNNQWKLAGEASSDKILLAFVKPNKTCMAVLDEGFGGSLGNTYLDLFITVDVDGGKRLNPFGEPVGN